MNILIWNMLWSRARKDGQLETLGLFQNKVKDDALEASVSMQDVTFKKIAIGQGVNSRVYLGTFGSECLAVKEIIHHSKVYKSTAFRQNCEKEVSDID